MESLLQYAKAKTIPAGFIYLCETNNGKKMRNRLQKRQFYLEYIMLNHDTLSNAYLSVA